MNDIDLSASSIISSVLQSHYNLSRTPAGSVLPTPTELVYPSSLKSFTPAENFPGKPQPLKSPTPVGLASPITNDSTRRQSVVLPLASPVPVASNGVGLPKAKFGTAPSRRQSAQAAPSAPHPIVSVSSAGAQAYPTYVFLPAPRSSKTSGKTFDDSGPATRPTITKPRTKVLNARPRPMVIRHRTKAPRPGKYLTQLPATPSWQPVEFRTHGIEESAGMPSFLIYSDHWKNEFPTIDSLELEREEILDGSSTRPNCRVLAKLKDLVNIVRRESRIG